MQNHLHCHRIEWIGRQTFKDYIDFRKTENLDHRDEIYDERVGKLMSHTKYNSSDLKVPSLRRRNMHVPFDRSNKDQWTTRPDLVSLWYAERCHREDKIQSPWTVNVAYRPYCKRRSGNISAMTYPRRPRLNVNRWRCRLDEDRFYDFIFSQVSQFS